MLELFSGIGGFTKGFIDAGYKIEEHYFSEIDKHAIANYKYNYPNAKYIGSVTDISGRDFTGIDIITFGSPCQDFSLAGKREGMDGKRSVLILEAIRLVTELRPSVFIWENVKGAFSSNSGADFWAILQAFANIGGYRLEWQLLNTKWFLPQNRERIYLVGHLAGRSKPGIFPIGEENKLYNKKEQTITGENTQESIAKCLNANDEKSWVGNFIEIPKIAGCLTGGGNSGGNHSDMTLIPVKPNWKCGFDVLKKRDEEYQIKAGTWRDYKGEIGIREMNDGLCPTLLARARADGSGQPVISYSMGNSKPGRSCINAQRIPEIGNEEKSIRRLTEIECERLQGFPDNWTQFGIYEKQVWINKKEKTFKIVEQKHTIPRTQRYKMLGNAVTVRVVEEIAKRIELL